MTVDTTEPADIDVEQWLARPTWMRRAACAGANQDLFFPGRGEAAAEAIAICHSCPVRADCLDYAMCNGERHGIWGGISERGRRQLRRQVRAS